MRWRSRSPAETHALGLALGAELAALRPCRTSEGEEGGGLAVALVGPLGAGKTAFAKGVAEGLGIDPARVASPTFVLANEYPLPGGGRLVHADLHRVEREEELLEIGWLDWLVPGVLLLVEWADRVPEALPADVLEVTLGHVPGAPSVREVAACARGHAAEALLRRWERRALP